MFKGITFLLKLLLWFILKPTMFALLLLLLYLIN